MILIVAIVAVLGLVAIGIILLLVSRSERESLYKLIKSRDLGEYVMATAPVEKPEEEPEEVDIPVDEIPYIEESKE